MSVRDYALSELAYGNRSLAKACEETFVYYPSKTSHVHRNCVNPVKGRRVQKSRTNAQLIACLLLHIELDARYKEGNEVGRTPTEFGLRAV